MKLFWIILAATISSTCCFLPLFDGRYTSKNGVKERPGMEDSTEGGMKTMTKTNEDDDESNLGSFFQNLGQWPLYPTSGERRRIENDEEERIELSAKSKNQVKDSNPLGNFLKLEVFLELADGLKGNKTDSYFSAITEAADQLFKSATAEESNDSEDDPIGLSNVTTVEELIEREKFLESLPNIASLFEGMDGENNNIARLSVTQSTAITSNKTQQSLGQAAEAIVKDATSRIEYLVNEASKGLTPTILNDLVDRSTQVFSSNGTTSVEQLSNDIVSVAENIAKTRGLDVGIAAERAREATKGASTLVGVANGLFEAGYAYGSRSGAAGSEGSPLKPGDSISESRPLFADFESAQRIEPFQYKAVVAKGAEMGMLSGSIYEDTLSRIHRLGHSLVANSTTADVAWMVTDSMDYASSFVEPDLDGPALDNDELIMVRTITMRGFDASDSTVDRERLLIEICNAPGVPISPETSNIIFHSGLLGIATQIYEDVKKYIDWTMPNHRIVLTGHSIGGSLSVLLLLLMAADKGADYVQNRILRVFAYGSPPVAEMISSPPPKQGKKQKVMPGLESTHCQVLETFGLPTTMVFGYIQPYDPIVRFLTPYDAMYPLVDDLGQDEVTLYATGPPRTLRPITRAMFQSWESWPEFRDNWKGTNQKYQSVGIQHLLLPEPIRYLNDRFISTQIGVPPAEAIVRISSSELLPALNATFPLDVFQISFLPQAVRSFLHHFYPAYDTTMASYAAKVERKTSS